MPKKLAIITTHPIQYYAPVFQLLAKELDVKVFYTWGERSMDKFDVGFNKRISWDIPLLEGYSYEFLENIAKDKGTHHFKGIINPTIIQRINTFGPDAILVYGWAWSGHLKVLRHFHGKVPIYFRGDSTLLNIKKGIKGFLKKTYLKWLYRHVDVAFNVGSANKAYFMEYGLKEKQLVFAPHAIDNNRFANKKEGENEIRKSLQLKADDILILFAGKLDPVKNPLLLLNAFSAINKENIHLLFVGNGSLEVELKTKVADSKISNLHFIGFQNQSQMPSVYQACDLFCLPSTSETWGLAVNEAMASGKAVLVSDKVGCSADLVSPAVGEIFKSGDLADLTQKLIALTASKAKLIELGKNAYNTIQDWSFERQVTAIVEYVNR